MAKFKAIPHLPRLTGRETDANARQLRPQVDVKPVPRPVPRRSLNEAAHKLPKFLLGMRPEATAASRPARIARVNNHARAVAR